MTATLALYFVVLAPLGYAALALLSVLPTRDEEARARRLQSICCWGFRTMHDWLRFIGIIDFDPREVQGRLPDGPCVVIANHRTLTDITSIMATFGPMTAVVKPEIYRMWWLRPIIEAAGFVRGSSTDPANLASVLDGATLQTHKGHRFLIFPEGTRAPGDELLPFGRTPFEIACRANVALAPIVLRWEHAWLSKDCRLFQSPAGRTRLRMDVLDPVFPEDFRGSSRAMRDMVETTFRARLPDSAARELEGWNGGISRESAQAAHR